MSKVNITTVSDRFGNPLILLSKKKGKISMREAYESLEKEDLFGHYLLHIPVPEDVPVHLYEDGDEWEVYESDVLLGERAEDKFNEGYEACLKEQCPESEWGGEGRGRHMCGCCGGTAPGNPLTGERWHSRICPHCGARMRNGEDL